MAKRRLKVVAKIQNYLVDEVKWKRAIYNAVTKAQRDAGVIYSSDDKLEVEICFNLAGHKLTKLDIDNRLKQVGDALQCFINDKGKLSNGRRRKPIVPNDNQIWSAEKRLPSKRDRNAPSTITIHAYTRDPRTATDPRETRKHT